MRDTPTAGIRAEEDGERHRHDQLYAAENYRGDDLRMNPYDWDKMDGTGDAHSAYITSVRWLGDLKGKTVLDVGCGTGWLSVILAKRGAHHVDGFDISEEAVRIARTRARVNGSADTCAFKQGSCYQIPFASATYDVVAGQAILHHVRNKDLVAQELDRVMKPGGVGAFYEPFGGSWLFERFRQRLPLSSDTDDPEHWKDKLKIEELEPFKARFDVTIKHFELVQRFSRYAPVLSSALAALDTALLGRVPPLRRFSRGIVIGLRKR